MVARLMPDELAPPVVAVVVAAEPGPWFEECLGGLAAQDYPNLDVLVVDVSADEEGSRGVAERVAAVLPSAFLRRHRPACGYAAGTNVVLEAVEGATHLLVCHDDVVLEPDACRLLVEEAYRSNAGVVAPKIVAYEDPERLLHVGLGADRHGAPVPRVEVGELDQGQHDEVREVFTAPGGCVLVREDLFRALGGFDETMTLFGEDVDFGWRAQLAGARVVVAPAARVRHLEASARGLRDATEASRLQRRHELRTALKCHGRLRLVVLLPVLLGLALAEAAVAALRGDREHARAVVAAWRWNLGELRSLLAARAALRGARRVRYRRVEARLVRHSTRLRRFLREPLERRATPLADPPLVAAGAGATSGSGGSAGAGEPEAFRSRPSHHGHRWSGEWLRGVEQGVRGARWRGAHRLGIPGRERLVLFGAAAVILAFGLRGLVGGHLPVVGGLGAAPPPLSLLGRFFGGWHDAGVQPVGAAPPALAVLGLGGLLLGGSTSQVVKLLLLGSPVVAAVGCARLVGALGSRRARDAAALAVLFAPLAWDDVARGDLQALVALAAAPFLLARLGRAGGLLPSSGGRSPEDSGLPTRGTLSPRAAWRRLGGLVADEAVPFGLLLALSTALAPVTVVVAGEIVAGVLLGSLVAGGVRAALRAAGVALGGLGVAFVVLLPWSASFVGPGARAAALTGVARAGGSTSLAALLRLAPGPEGPSLLGFGFLVAGGFALLVGRGHRLAWATRAWAVVLVSVGLAWAGAEGWLGDTMGATGALLAPAAVGLALAIGLGVSAFEVDLPTSRFGWRQPAALVATACFLVALLPVVALTPSGRFGLPSVGYGQVLGWIGPGRGSAADGRRGGPSSAGGSLVLWAGAPGALPLGGWPAGADLEIGVSRSGVPDLTRSYPSPDPARAGAMASALETALAGRTVELGALLAPLGVGYVVVPEATAPVLPGVQSASAVAPPSGLLGALGAQTDLRQLPAEGGVAVFENMAAPTASPPAARGGGGPLRVLGLLAALGALVGLLAWRRRRSRALVRAARKGAESMQAVLPRGRILRGRRESGPFAGARGAPRHARPVAPARPRDLVGAAGEAGAFSTAQPAARPRSPEGGAT
jgi:GT2 family glycosyltransferase